MAKSSIEESLKDKLLLLHKKGVSFAAIARESGVKQDNVYKWKKGINPQDAKDYLKLQAYLNNKLGITSKRELEGVPENPYSREPEYEYGTHPKRPDFVAISLTKNQDPEKYTDRNASAGTIVNLNGETALVVYSISTAVFGGAQGMVEVVGESMMPAFKTGALIAIKRLEDPLLIEWGEYYYLVDKNKNCFLKKIMPGEKANTLKLVSENNVNFPPTERLRKDIIAIFKVKAVIMKH